MVKEKIQGILQLLSFSKSVVDLRRYLRNGRVREWHSVLHWLDSSGLALYFLSVLERSNGTDAVPEHVLSELKQRQEQNRLRMDALRHTFNFINGEFSREGVDYVVLKGFSLLPHYCEDESLRAQSDLDYLISPNSLDNASRALRERGYVLKRRTPGESVFWIPSREPWSCREQYDTGAPCVIELHIALWEETRLPAPLRIPTLVLGPAKVQQWKESIFPALAESEIFYHQVLHLFQHVVEGRVRLCHFYELAYFMDRSADCATLWLEFESMLCSEPKLQGIAGLISAMASEVFRGSRPAVLKRWSQELSPPVRLWIRKYSQSWLIEGAGDAICFFSSAKLALLLREQYLSVRQRRTLQLRSLLPVEGLRRLVKSRMLPVMNSRRTSPKHARVLSRLFYHLGANLRYLCEVPRWRLTKRYFRHSNSSDPV